MTKITLTAVYHNDKDRDGKPYVAQKTGKPYTKCNIKCAEYGDKYLSGFGNALTKTWNVGDTVEIEIEQKGEYLNFSVPKKQEGGLSDLDREFLIRIEKKVDAINWYVVEMAKAMKTGSPVYPTPEVEGIDTSLENPFDRRNQETDF